MCSWGLPSWAANERENAEEAGIARHEAAAGHGAEQELQLYRGQRCEGN